MMASGLGTAGLIFLFVIVIFFVVGLLVLLYLVFFRHSEAGTHQATVTERWKMDKNHAVWFDGLGKLKWGVHVSKPHIINGEPYRDFSEAGSQGAEDFIGKFSEEERIKIDCEQGSDVPRFTFVESPYGKVYAQLVAQLADYRERNAQLNDMLRRAQTDLRLIENTPLKRSAAISEVSLAKLLLDAGKSSVRKEAQVTVRGEGEKKADAGDKGEG